MSTGRILTVVSAIVFVVLLLGILNGGGNVEIYNFSVSGWLVAVVAYLLGWGAAFGYVLDQKR